MQMQCHPIRVNVDDFFYLFTFFASLFFVATNNNTRIESIKLPWTPNIKQAL